jgi:hypothetical protein
MLVNRYSIFQRDIEPLDFDVVVMDTYVTEETIDTVNAFLNNPGLVDMITDSNYELGRKYFSYNLLEQRLKQVFMNFGQL